MRGNYAGFLSEESRPQRNIDLFVSGLSRAQYNLILTAYLENILRFISDGQLIQEKLMSCLDSIDSKIKETLCPYDTDFLLVAKSRIEIAIQMKVLSDLSEAGSSEAKHISEVGLKLLELFRNRPRVLSVDEDSGGQVELYLEYIKGFDSGLLPANLLEAAESVSLVDAFLSRVKIVLGMSLAPEQEKEIIGEAVAITNNASVLLEDLQQCACVFEQWRAQQKTSVEWLDVSCKQLTDKVSVLLSRACQNN